MRATTGFVGVAALASQAMAGGYLMDQIVSSDGGFIDTSNILASQYFEAAFSVYDIAAIDDFDNANGSAASAVSAVIGGWNGYTSIDGVSGVQANFYTAIEDAAVNLVGYASADGGVVLDADWAGQIYGDMVTLEAVYALLPGQNLVTLIAVNEFGTNGQTGLCASLEGDGNAWQANPGGGFGMPNNCLLYPSPSPRD